MSRHRHRNTMVTDDGQRARRQELAQRDDKARSYVASLAQRIAKRQAEAKPKPERKGRRAPRDAAKFALEHGRQRR